MRMLLDNGYFILACRLALGFIFVVASIDKVADPGAFAISIGYYRLIGPEGALYAATLLAWLELICGLFLIFGIFLRGSSLLVMLMLLIFTAGVVSGIIRGLDISCGCFSRDPNVGKIGWLKVAENSGLILLALAVLFSTTKRFLVLTPPQKAIDESAQQ